MAQASAVGVFASNSRCLLQTRFAFGGAFGALLQAGLSGWRLRKQLTLLAADALVAGEGFEPSTSGL